MNETITIWIGSVLAGIVIGTTFNFKFWEWNIEENNDKLYVKLKILCKERGCYLPEKHIVLGKVANTPLYLRLWFRLKGSYN